MFGFGSLIKINHRLNGIQKERKEELKYHEDDLEVFRTLTHCWDILIIYALYVRWSPLKTEPSNCFNTENIFFCLSMTNEE